MIARLPLIPTVLVLLCVGVMIRLGVWQLDRKDEKEALLERYAAAESAPPVTWPRKPSDAEILLYRSTSLDCADVTAVTAMAGSNASGVSGMAHVADCRLADGDDVKVVLGWSRDPAPREWAGGPVTGTIAPGGETGPRLVADPPLAGLEANARPDPSSIPNNHLSYAVQWFLFAVTALVIYGLAVRKRLLNR